MKELDNCLICKRIDLWKKNKNPYFIKEFQHTIFVVGDHQYFAGYSLLLYKNHVREITDLSPQIQSEIFLEVMSAGKIIQKVFSPYKLNYSCYGNTEEHLHWHIFPRYEDDPNRKLHPWLNCSDFKNHKINIEHAKEIARTINNAF